MGLAARLQPPRLLAPAARRGRESGRLQRPRREAGLSGRVVVGDPSFDLDDVRSLLAGRDVEVAGGTEPWGGDDVVALLVSTDTTVGPAELDRLPRLEIVATCSVGHDHIDLEAATARGVWVCNVPDYCIDEVADHSLALLLGLLRGVVELDRHVRVGGWDWTAAGPLRRIRGLRLGVVGFGRLGCALAERALALGMEVWATDPGVDEAAIRAAGVRPASFDELLGSCEAFSLHATLTEETRGLIGEAELMRMPPGSVIVDTARAQLLDLDAVLRALESRHLAGVALDVLAVEPPTLAHPAPQAPGLVVTPHAAWYSPEAEAEVYRRPVLAIRDVLDGREPADAVNRPGAPPGNAPIASRGR